MNGGGFMYWQAVLNEVLNKNSEKSFLFTNLKRGSDDRQKIKPEGYKTYKLGSEYGDSYLTHREAECALRLIQGKTILTIAAELQLSPRTVEFYLKNIKSKFRCRTKAELIEKVLHSNFLTAIDF